MNASTRKQRRFSITSHMGMQPCHTLCFPTAFAQDYTEAGYNQNVMTRAPRFARRRIA
ncbi:MAG: hypothetical protein Q8O41_05900 [Candidatus Methanoperedens sp.]|nr:hypothetical protein [Candidatus Methanoperedens sp.]